MSLIFKHGIQYPQLVEEVAVKTFILPEEYVPSTTLVYDQAELVGLICLESYEEAGYEYAEFMPEVQALDEEKMLYIKYAQTFKRGYLRQLLKQVFEEHPTIDLLVAESDEEAALAWSTLGATYYGEATMEHREGLMGFTLNRRIFQTI